MGMAAPGSEVRTDGGNGGHDLAELELVQNRRLTSSIESYLNASCAAVKGFAREVLRLGAQGGSGVHAAP